MIFDENYQYIKLLGEGGFGKVALAKDVLAERLVAIKWLKETDPSEQKYIIHEIKTVANLGQKGIVTFFHHFKKDKNIYLVMEYCENGSLSDKIIRPLMPGVVLPWFEILCETLHFIHLNKIVHHDIKPDNILFSGTNEVKISDFGVANKIAGTQPYIAPELLIYSRSDATDPRVDVFALGVTLLESLTAENPFAGKTPIDKIEIVKNRRIKTNNLPEWLQNIIYRSIDPTPELRFQSALDMAEALKSQFAPAILDTKLIQSGNLAAKAETYLKVKKWRKTFTSLNAALALQQNNLKALRTFGQYYLLQNNITEAKNYFGQLLQLNPRAEVHKEYGWMQLESGNHREAVSLLNDYLQRNPNDTEAHNLLARCFYELGLFEQTSQYLRELINAFPKLSCFRSNLLLTKILLKEPVELLDGPNGNTHDEIDTYNLSILNDSPKSWDNEAGPSIKSKLLYREHRFEKGAMKENEIEVTFDDNKKYFFKNRLVPFGRYGYPRNNIKELDDSSISRKHFVIINTWNDVWLYNVSQFGTVVDGEVVVQKKFLHGLHEVKIGDKDFTIKTNPNLLF